MSAETAQLILEKTEKGVSILVCSACLESQLPEVMKQVTENCFFSSSFSPQSSAIQDPDGFGSADILKRIFPYWPDDLEPFPNR